MATTIHKMSCPYDCPSTCGLEAEIEDGRLIKVKNDKTHPVSKNGICRKMQHYEQDIYSADRLRTPLRRVGRKGEAKTEHSPQFGTSSLLSSTGRNCDSKSGYHVSRLTVRNRTRCRSFLFQKEVQI